MIKKNKGHKLEIEGENNERIGTLDQDEGVEKLKKLLEKEKRINACIEKVKEAVLTVADGTNNDMKTETLYEIGEEYLICKSILETVIKDICSIMQTYGLLIEN